MHVLWNCQCDEYLPPIDELSERHPYRKSPLVLTADSPEHIFGTFRLYSLSPPPAPLPPLFTRGIFQSWARAW